MEARQSRGAISRRVPARESSAGGREKAACLKAEREKARPKGAWGEERRRSRAERKGACVRTAPVVVVRGCSEENEKARVDADRGVRDHDRVCVKTGGSRSRAKGVARRTFRGVVRGVFGERGSTTVCARQPKLGAIFATIRPERAGLPGPARKGSPLFLFIWVFVRVCCEALSVKVGIV